MALRHLRACVSQHVLHRNATLASLSCRTVCCPLLTTLCCSLSRSLCPPSPSTNTLERVFPMPHSEAMQVSTSATSAAEGAKEGGQQQGWGQTRIADLLRKKQGDAGAWLWCAGDDTVLNAVKKMAKGNVGSLLVFDPAKISLDKSPESSANTEAVVGIVTERDYLLKVAVKGKSSAELPVKDIMTPASKLTTVDPGKSVLDVMTLMVERNFRHVPVVDGDSYLGMISIRDVVGTMVQEHKEEVDRIHEYIQGSY